VEEDTAGFAEDFSEEIVGRELFGEDGEKAPPEESAWLAGGTETEPPDPKLPKNRFMATTVPSAKQTHTAAFPNSQSLLRLFL
jgi:hypothetical protein